MIFLRSRFRVAQSKKRMSQQKFPFDFLAMEKTSTNIKFPITIPIIYVFMAENNISKLKSRNQIVKNSMFSTLK